MQACPGCSRLILARERICPFCQTSLRSAPSLLQLLGVSVLLGVGITGCDKDSEETEGECASVSCDDAAAAAVTYGGPPESESWSGNGTWDATSETFTTGDTDNPTQTTTGSTTSDMSTSSGPSTETQAESESDTETESGTEPETDTDTEANTDTETETESGTDTSDSGSETSG